MRPLYVTGELASVLYWAVVVVWAGSEMAYYFRFGGGVRSDQDRWSGPALIGGLLLSIWLGGVVWRAAPGAAMTFEQPVLFAVGLVLAVAGITLRFYSIRTLGDFFRLRVTTTAGQSIVDRGPYRLVRHPSYTGALMTVVGVLLCATNWLSLACFVLALPGFAYRMKVEEGALAGAIGEPYRDHMKRTKRLIPYVL